MLKILVNDNQNLFKSLFFHYYEVRQKRNQTVVKILVHRILILGAVPFKVFPLRVNALLHAILHSRNHLVKSSSLSLFPSKTKNEPLSSKLSVSEKA